MNKQRVIQATNVIGEPNRVSTTTRIKPDEQDQFVLEELGSWYAEHFYWVFGQRNQLGADFTGEDRARLKRELTARGMSSRWAGALLTDAMQTWRSGRKNQQRYMNSLRSRINQIEYRLDPANERPYPRHEHWFKQQRLVSLRAKLVKAEAQYATGWVKHVRGGHKLFRNRLHLEASQFPDEAAWREAWVSARERSVQAPGEPGALGGNQTIRLTSEGYLQIKLPECLIHLSNAANGRYQFSQPINFTYRNTELFSAMQAQQSVGYRVRYDSERQRWYVDATFKPAYPEREKNIQVLRTNNIVGVDLNKNHVSVAVVNHHGNLLQKPFDIQYQLTGSTSARDAQIRHVITQIIHVAKQYEASIAIENLDFEAEKTLSKGKYSKTFRSTLHNFPVSTFRTRLQGMTSTAGVPLLAVDPAYTSKWGQAYWAKPLDLTTHQAAAFMIARRAYKYCLKRKTPVLNQWKKNGLTDSNVQTVTPGEPSPQVSFNPSVGLSSELVLAGSSS